ncbi:MAG: maltose alpha-D-glucosyltransferase [Thermoleophilia bacterium]|nr:maltose alpha-D-glucosyltransferase [Thermoleophilia bacterium]
MTDADPNIRWYQDAVIYQVHIKAFRDSDGDGTGDFRGLISKLDYLQDLGVTAIWILPFYPSPLRDDGYDTADYRTVNPLYGDMRAFKQFMKEAKGRGLRVITELVLNHTSDQHAWFQRARRAPIGHPHRDFYVWSDDNTKYADTRIIFKDFETSNWSWDELAGQYYWHRFYHHQPDLNWENPEVVRELYSIVDFWLDLGVDGLRLDAVPYLFEREGTNGENLPETHAALKALRAHVDANHDDKMLLAEANMWPDEVVDYLGDGDECHMAFHFPLMPRMFMATRMEDRFPIIDILQDTPPIPANAQWATFLRNHDELTLEMVTDEERDYMWRIYAEDKRARINLGIRRRLAPLLGNNRRLIELMNGLLFSLPGTPVIYYGDEIGMGDNIYLGDRDGVRTPMQWSADRNAGFSDANPQKLYLPVVIDPEYHSSSVNVEAQQGNSESLLWWMKRILARRQRHGALRHGSLEWVPSENRKVLTYLRADADERILCVANLSRHTQYVELDLRAHAGSRPVTMDGHAEFPVIGELPYLLTVGPHDFFWFVLEPAPADDAHDARLAELPKLTVDAHWSELLTASASRRLTSLLKAYLPERRWFRSKSHRIRSVALRDVIPVGGTTSNPVGYVTMIDVEFADIDTETYVLPLVAEEVDSRPNHTTPLPPSTIATVTYADGREFAIYDGLQHDGFNESLLHHLTARRKGVGRNSVLVGATTPTLKRIAREGTSQEPRALSIEQTNSTVVYGDRFLLKVFRLLEDGVNPDVEIGRYLSEGAKFAHSPAVAATLEYRLDDEREDEPPRTLAMLQEYVPNEGDAWSFTLDALRRYIEDALAREDPPTMPSQLLMQRTHRELPDLAHETIGTYLEMARTLGVRTAEMHIALAAAPSEDAAMGPEPVVPMYRRSLYQSMRASTKRAFATLRRLQREQPDLADILPLEERILERFQALLGVGLGDLRIRCHGDYHLGQVLWTGRDVRIIDFEGEPGRPIGERRIRRSPLKDVAGMLRSFNYAACTIGQEHHDPGEDSPQAGRADQWLQFWYRCVSATFLRAYLDTAGDGGFLPASEADLTTMLESLLIEKAVYELAYEADNRPDWVWIPARGIQEILGD